MNVQATVQPWGDFPPTSPYIYNPPYYNTWVTTPKTKKVTTTVREYDEKGNVVKETVTEEVTTVNQGGAYDPPYRVTYDTNTPGE